MSEAEQPPAAPDEPAMAVHEPTVAAPAVGPAFEAPPPPAPLPAAGGVTEQHPEFLVGGAFAGGIVLALVLKRFGR